MSPILKRAVEIAHAEEAERIEKLGIKGGTKATLRAHRNRRNLDAAAALGLASTAAAQFATNPAMAGANTATALATRATGFTSRKQIARDLLSRDKGERTVGAVAGGLRIMHQGIAPAVGAADFTRSTLRRNKAIRYLRSRLKRES